MHAAVLAVFLLTTTVDPRPEERLWLLGEVGAREGQRIGESYSLASVLAS